MPGKRLLTVDDDPRACRIIERVAERLHYEVFSLDQSGQFQTAYEYFKPDIIVLDLCMEQVDGVELLRFLADKNSTAQVVLISGVDERLLATTTNLGRSMGLDMLVPLQKPVDVEVLYSRLSQLTTSQSQPRPRASETLSPEELATAIHRNELIIHYQPVIELRSNRLVAAEALARWNHPTEGLIPAQRFISLAQNHGLIKSLTSKLLVSAVESAAEWREQLADISLYVNIPADLLQNLNLPDHIFELLRFYNFSPRRLVLEVATGQEKEHLTSTIDVLTRLRLKGIRLAYDNLGIHPSCLEPTHRLPFDILKLDPLFVSDFTRSASTVAVANSIVELANAMSCELVAVGIEDDTTKQRLAKLGCKLGQGFAIAPPMRAGDFVNWARTREEHTIEPEEIPVSEESVGPRGFHNSLLDGYMLHWYEIQSVLGSGGFGITYLARDNNLGRQVAIKEYFPKDMARRENDSRVYPVSDNRIEEFGVGVDRFLKEARTLAKCQHPNIVRVYSVFEANGTAYMVMDYQRGQALSRAVRAGEIEAEADVLAIVRPLLDGLALIHDAGFIHRDIKPDNIFIREDGVPVLLDFGAARQSAGMGAQHFTMMFTPSYAPIEQYNSSNGAERQGPWTDIYSLGATLYRIITGRGPVDAVSRANMLIESNKDAYVPIRKIKFSDYSPQFLDAIDRALAFRPSERPQSVGDWAKMFPDAAGSQQRLRDEDSTSARRERNSVNGEQRSGEIAASERETTIGARHEANSLADRDSPIIRRNRFRPPAA